MSAQSMTGFGRAESEGQNIHVLCEVRSLNSRFLDVNVRLPRSLVSLETKLIGHVKKQLLRGKIDVYFEISTSGSVDKLPKLNLEAVDHYASLVKDLQENLRKTLISSCQDPSAADFFKMEGVLEAGSSQSTLSADQAEGAVHDALSQAIQALIGERKREGKVLVATCLGYVDTVQENCTTLTEQIESLRSVMLDQYQQRLEQSLASVAKGFEGRLSLDSDRLAMEVALIGEKTDIAEELIRLDAHCKETAKCLRVERSGRKLDFLCQELHREVNTISSKVSHTRVAEMTLAMRQAIERLRQQVQNVE